jgi:preprotein translocase subunit SecA
MVSKAIENAQKKVEGNNFDIRKTLLGYDDVMNIQREVIYKQRAEVLEGEDVKDEVLSMTKEIIADAVNTHITGETENYREEFLHLMVALQEICIAPGTVNLPSLENLANEEIVESLYESACKFYDQKEEEFTPERLREIERVVVLRAVDTNWMSHIDNMDHLKQGIGLQSFKQIDPVQAYQMEGSEMFNEMIKKIKEETVKLLFHVKIERAPERVRVAQETAAIHEDSSSAAVGPGAHPSTSPSAGPAGPVGPVRNLDKHGRNDLCSCGSGKKFKNCCGREA